LDGSFPVDTIPEELVVFLTQQNNFDIYIYGDVPISQTLEEGKFSFERQHVKSFNNLSESVFQQLPKINAFHLKPVDIVLKNQGIGTLPVKKVLVGVIVLVLLWMIVNYITTHKKELPISIVGVINPYQLYLANLTSPAPSDEIKNLNIQLAQIFSMPGWIPSTLEYNKGVMRFSVKSMGTDAGTLSSWAKRNRFQLEIARDGFYLTQTLFTRNRIPPTTINRLDDVIINVVDRLQLVLPGNRLTLGETINRGQYKEMLLTINVDDITLATLGLIARQLNNLPLVISKISFTFPKGMLSGTIILLALGN